MKIKKHSLYFEPTNPITDPKEFTNELIKYCNDNDKNLTINHESMEPIVTIDEIKYICMLEQPRMIDTPILPIYYTSSFDYKWVYLYEYKNTK